MKKTERVEPPQWFADWFAGFVDGEGSFNIATHGGRGLQPRLAIKLRDDDEGALKLIQSMLGGSIHAHRQNPSNKHWSPRFRDQVMWTLSGRDCARVVRLLRRSTLRTKKARELEIWNEAVEIYSAGAPLNRWSQKEIGTTRDHRLWTLKRALEGTRIYAKQGQLLDPGPQAFQVLVADPGWSFRDALPGPKRGARKHYDCMPLDEICAFPLPPVALSAWLFLWRVASMQEEALRVVEAWGFRATAEICWVKTTAEGEPRMGMGHYTRNAHEICLVCVRGSPKRRNANVPSVILAPRGRHSEKPDAFFAAVENLAEGPYCELFARRERPGWTSYGAGVGRPHP